MLTGPIYTVQNIGPEFCVRGCDIARACKGYIISEDTKLRSYIMYIGPISILYTIYCMCAHGRFIIYKLTTSKG